MVELRGIRKYFPSNGVTALENAGLTLCPGEIHALLGENGTGKSTLMHILAGYFPPTSGTILVDGKERRFSASADALALGIGMVRQHPGFIKNFKVWEDCILGAERQDQHGGGASPRRNSVFQKARSLFFSPGVSRKRVEELSKRWGFDLPLNRETESLTVSQRQKAAVLALLLRDVKWFIFDEPTAVLTPGETRSLFELFNRLRGDGRGIILITHKLDEALAISDRVTVIRHGVTGEARNTGGLSIDDLKNSIFNAGEDKRPSAQPVHPAASDPAVNGREQPILLIKDLLLEPPGMAHIRNVNLCLMPGKILGITGVRDSGLETLELAVAGLMEKPGKGTADAHESRKCKFEGSITLNGHDISGKGVRAFRSAGGAYLGADRLGSNLAPELPLKESLIIHAARRARRRFRIFLDINYLNSWCKKIMSRAGIARPVSGKAVSFSGGMLQRILLAREFAEEASLVVLAEAGSGLDQFNRARLTEELKLLVRRGASALLFSTDPDELLSTADEIMVLKNGALTAVSKAALENHEI